MKLYIIVQKALSTGLKCAQACHAMHAFTQAYPDITREWETSNNVVVLEHEDMPGLAATLEEALSSFSSIERSSEGSGGASAAEARAWRVRPRRPRRPSGRTR